jgi:hypothetical protein
MMRNRPGRSARRCRLGLGRGLLPPFGGLCLHRNRRRGDLRRWRKPNLDQLLDRVARAYEIDVEATEQDEAKRDLHDGDERECGRALTRPHRSESFSFDGHFRPSWHYLLRTQ